MKDKIIEILEGSIDPWGERDTNDIVEEILDLLKEESWKPPEEIPDCEICLERNEDMMRDKGWLHKDDLVHGLNVVRDCPCEELSAREHCECVPKRPLTVVEALAQFLSAIQHCYSGKCNPVNEALLTTKDGGMVEVEK